MEHKTYPIVIFAVFCGLIKLILAALPESAVLASFCRVPAEVAAFYNYYFKKLKTAQDIAEAR